MTPGTSGAIWGPALGAETNTGMAEKRAGRNLCVWWPNMLFVVQSPSHVQLFETPIPHHLWEFAQVHVRCIGDAIQPSHPLSPPSPSTLNLS